MVSSTLWPQQRESSFSECIVYHNGLIGDRFLGFRVHILNNLPTGEHIIDKNPFTEALLLADLHLCMESQINKAEESVGLYFWFNVTFL